ncbi:reverse transcriptase domain-containing protein [Tanacetum coccineum]
MRTRFQTRNRNRQQQSQQDVAQPFHLEEPFVNPPLVPMADNRTMAQLLQAPTKGYEDAIVIPEINANFELKHGLINLVQNKQFFEHDKEDPHAHIRYFNKITSTMRFLNVPSRQLSLCFFRFLLKIFKQRFDESFYEAWDRFNDLLRACPHHGFSELHQLDTFYNALNANDQDSLNSAAGGNFLDKMPRECLRIIERVNLNELDRTNALADSGASINLLPHSIYKQLGLGALKPTRMTLELANRSVTHPMGIAEDVVVRVDGFTFLADFVVVNFEPDPRVPIILGRPFLRTAKALIDLYEEKLTLRVGNDELVFYAEKSEKSKNKQFAHAIYVIDFLKDEPFSGSITNHSDALPPSSSPVKTSDNLEEFADELPLLKRGVQEENFQVYSNPLFEFDDDFTSSNENPLFNEIDEDVENKNSNVSDFDETILLNTPLTDKVESFAPEDDIDEIYAFLAMKNLLSDDTTHNLAPEVISDHESITFSPRSDPLHHEFAGELLILPSRIAREHEDYLSRMTLLCEISTSRSQENVHANPSSIIESLPVSLIPVEDSDPVQEEIDIFLVPDNLIPPGVENDDSEDEDNSTFFPENKSSILEPSSPRPPPEPPDICFNIEPGTAMNDEDFNQGEIVLSLNVEYVNSFTFVIWTFLPFFTYPKDSLVILSFGSEDLDIDFMGPFPSSRGNKYIHVAVDYLSKWVEAKALPTNDARIVVKFLKSLFARFGTLRAIISDRGTHFCNDKFAKVMSKTVGENRASWSDKLDDALWAFRTAFKTPIGCTPYKLVYGKSCHLPIELEHRAYWALKHANFDLKTAGDHRKLQLNELNELHDQAYENSLIKKRRRRKLHDSKNQIEFSMSFTITKFFPYGTIELSQPDVPNFKVNVIRLNALLRGLTPQGSPGSPHSP